MNRLARYCLLVRFLLVSGMFGPECSGAEVTSTRLAAKQPGNAVVQQPVGEKPGWHGWPADAPQPAIAPFTAEQAMKHQELWAVYLKVPVAYTNSIGMKFMLIPPGEFMMGSMSADIEEALKFVDEDGQWQACIKSEAPIHKVILTQPKYLGVGCIPVLRQ